MPRDPFVRCLYRAFVRRGLGEKNKALENRNLAYLEGEPLLDGLRPEPGFQTVVEKMNLDP